MLEAHQSESISRHVRILSTIAKGCGNVRMSGIQVAMCSKRARERVDLTPRAQSSVLEAKCAQVMNEITGVNVHMSGRKGLGFRV